MGTQQIYYRPNLTDAQFPLVSTFQGKTVIQPGLDQNYQTPPAISTEERDRGIPEAWYMHNVIPSLYGYKSVAYTQLLAGTGVVGSVVRQFAVKDFAGHRGHVIVTDAGKTYLITNLSLTWTDITPAGQPADVDVSAADATGTSFICYAGFGIFTINLATSTLSPATIQWDSPLTNASMLVIASSNNYLLTTDGTYLYWSSALDVLDFRKSQITGAGSGVPTGAVGKLVTMAKVGIGFAIYCQGSIVVATFSGNVQFPWLFKEAPNGAGVASLYHVSATGDEGSNYAWTSAGLLKVTLAGCTAVSPEVSDFLGGRIFEDYNYSLDTLTRIPVSNPMNVRVAFVSSRYLMVSYGPSSLAYTLVYDASLKRWGKLKVTHSQIFDLSFRFTESGTPYATFLDSMPKTNLDYAAIPYTGTVLTIESIAAEAKHSIAAIQEDGTLIAINVEYNNTAAEAVLILGKYQIARAKLIGIQGYSIETIDSANANFETKVLTSLDGKNTAFITDPYETIDDNMREYLLLAHGVNHSILFKGAFHIVGGQFVFTIESNR